MPTLNPTQLGYLRDSHPHRAKINLSVIVPEVVYVGTIAGSPARGDTDITMVDDSGVIADVEEGMTIWVGTSSGDKSIGKRRFRSRAGQVFTVDKAPLVWQNGWFFTVVKYWELWSKFPYISGTDGAYTFYKDEDITYTDQNEKVKPVAIAGSHQVGYLTGATIVFDLDGSDSYAMTTGISIYAWEWECSDGVILDDTASVTTITFNAPGIYWVKLTVWENDWGKSQHTWRVIRVHSDADLPYYDFELTNALSGSWSKGGWDVGLTVHGDADQDEFPDGALVILWAEQYFDTTQVSISGDNILFIGYLEGETVIKEFDTGSVSFDAYTIQGRMDNCNMYSVSLTEVDSSPSTWNDFYAPLTVARASHHYWRWHSTLFEMCDVYLPISNVLTMPAQDFEEGTLYGAIDSFAHEHGIFAHVCSDKKGIIRVEEDLQMLSDSDRAAATVVMAITDPDRTGDTDLEILRNSQVRTKIIEVGGIDGDKNPFLSQAPGIVPEPFGSQILSFEGLVLEDQAYANFISGRLYAISNLELEEIRIPMAGNYSFMDIALQEWYTIAFIASTNKRGLAYSGNIILRDISIDVDIVNGIISVDSVVEPEATNAYDGVTIIPGEYNPVDYPDPVVTLPEWPALPWPAPEAAGSCPLFGLTTHSLYYNPNILNSIESSWIPITGDGSGINSDMEGNIDSFCVDVRSYDPLVVNLYCVVDHKDNEWGSRIYAAYNIFGAPLIWRMHAMLPTPVSDVYKWYRGIQVNPAFTEQGMTFRCSRLATLRGDEPKSIMRAYAYFVVLGQGYTHSTGYMSEGASVNITYNNSGVGLVTFSTQDDPDGSGDCYTKAVVTSNNGATISYSWSFLLPGSGSMINHARSASGQVIYMLTRCAGGGGAVYVNKSINGGATWNNVYTNIGLYNPYNNLLQHIGVADDPNYAMFSVGTNARLLYRTSNGGSSWDSVSTGAPLVALRKTSISPMHWFSGSYYPYGVRYTSDFGSGWQALTLEGIKSKDEYPVFYQLETLIK